jgi:NADPH:quinone reductase-like Zn-dependent oxidoreductase
MKAITIDHRPELGCLSKSIRLTDEPVPEPGKRDVMIEVHYSSINIDDLHVSEGSFYGGIPVGPKPSKTRHVIPGTDFSGIVKKVGPKVTRFKAGDLVFGIHSPTTPGGPWAEFCCTHEDYVMHKPDHLPLDEAPACAQAGLVAFDAVMLKNSLERGQKCLVVGASGGIGSLAIQFAKQCGAYTIAVCSKRNAPLAKSLGADEVIDYTSISFAEALEAREKLDLVVDMVGGKEIENDAMSVLKKEGSFTTVVGPVQYIGDTHLGWVKISKIFSYIGWRSATSRLRGPKYQLAGTTKAVFRPLEEYLTTHTIKPAIDRKIGLTEPEMQDGISYLATHRARGKVIIKIHS